MPHTRTVLFSYWCVFICVCVSPIKGKLANPARPAVEKPFFHCTFSLAAENSTVEPLQHWQQPTESEPPQHLPVYIPHLVSEGQDRQGH